MTTTNTNYVSPSDAFEPSEPRMAYFVLESERDDRGFIPCIAVEGERGYHKTDWHWNCSIDDAEKLCDEKNKNLGFTPREAMMIVFSTMRKI